MTDWPVWLLAVIDVLAVHRLAHLVTTDVITVRPRRAIIKWAYIQAGHDENLIDEIAEDAQLEHMVEEDMTKDPCSVPRFAVLVTCRWCVSIWLAAGVVAAHALIPAVWLPIAGLLALSSGSTLLARLED